LVLLHGGVRIVFSFVTICVVLDGLCLAAYQVCTRFVSVLRAGSNSL
jgi:hypothetical protein